MSDPVLAPGRGRARGDDLEASRDLLDDLYGARLRLSAIPGGRSAITIEQRQAGPVISVDLVSPADLRFDIETGDDFAVTCMLSGTCELRTSHEAETFGRGDVYFAVQPKDAFAAHSVDVRCRNVSFTSGLLAEVVEMGVGEPAPLPRVLARRPLPEGAARFRRAVRLFDQLLETPDAAAAELVVGPATRVVAATALTAFATTVTTGTTPRDRRDARPSALARAVDFIDANADLDISLVDIARAARVTPRAVQIAFRRHLDTTPLAHLRSVRLSRARDDLRTAVPGPGTVTRIALDWGFASAGRFTQHYRAAYGETPTETLTAAPAVRP